MMKIILSDFVEELWFYEYHEGQYEGHRKYLEFIGRVNRNKFLPIFIKDIFGSVYEQYTEFRKSWGHIKKPYTNEKFLKIEGESTFFISNTAKLFI